MSMILKSVVLIYNLCIERWITLKWKTPLELYTTLYLIISAYFSGFISERFSVAISIHKISKERKKKKSQKYIIIPATSDNNTTSLNGLLDIIFSIISGNCSADPSFKHCPLLKYSKKADAALSQDFFWKQISQNIRTKARSIEISIKIPLNICEFKNCF